MPVHITRAALGAMAKIVENEMLDACVITREAQGPGAFDSATGLPAMATTVVYEGKCLLGDRVEGAFTSGGFGGNPQEFAADARTHFALLRLPLGMTDPVVGDLVNIVGGDQWRITAHERATHKVSSTYRISRYDLDASRA